MNTIEVMQEFFGWCSIINIGVLLFSTVMVIAIRKTAERMHGKMFNLDAQTLSKAYFQYLAQYKMATIIFCIVPYIALKLMG